MSTLINNTEDMLKRPFRSANRGATNLVQKQFSVSPHRAQAIVAGSLGVIFVAACLISVIVVLVMVKPEDEFESQFSSIKPTPDSSSSGEESSVESSHEMESSSEAESSLLEHKRLQSVTQKRRTFPAPLQTPVVPKSVLKKNQPPKRSADRVPKQTALEAMPDLVDDLFAPM